MSKIIGSWKIGIGVLAGFNYTFYEDKTFKGEFSTYNVNFKGTYEVNEDVFPHEVDLNVTEHNQGEIGKGLVQGIYEVEGDMLKMKLNEPNKGRWTDPSAYVYYQKEG